MLYLDVAAGSDLHRLFVKPAGLWPCRTVLRDRLRFRSLIKKCGMKSLVDDLLFGLFAAACCGCNPAAAAASTVFFSLWIAAAAVQTAATVSACSLPNTPFVDGKQSIIVKILRVIRQEENNIRWRS
jgi:hypothetical protein